MRIDFKLHLTLSRMHADRGEDRGAAISSRFNPGPATAASTATVAMTNALPSSFGLSVTKEQVSYHISFGQRPFKPWTRPVRPVFCLGRHRCHLVAIASDSMVVMSMLLGPCYVCGLVNPCREILQVP